MRAQDISRNVLDSAQIDPWGDYRIRSTNICINVAEIST